MEHIFPPFAKCDKMNFTGPWKWLRNIPQPLCSPHLFNERQCLQPSQNETISCYIALDRIPPAVETYAVNSLRQESALKV